VPSSQETFNNAMLPYYMNDPDYQSDDNNLDGFDDTEYLRIVESSSVNFTITSTNNLSPTAQLFNGALNDDNGEWVNLLNPDGQTNPDAEATVPLKKTGEFKLRLENKGNTYLGDIHLLDILPFVGDTMVRDPSVARGSQWAASLDSLDVVIKDADGNDVTSDFHYTLRYSTQDDPSYNAGVGDAKITRAGDDGTFSTSGATMETRNPSTSR
jgi:hypothetical protein